MKQPGPEIGNLSSKFFAYVQLKKKDIVRAGELSPVLDITQPQELDLLRRLTKSGWIIRLKRGTYLVPPRIPAGGKYSAGVALILQALIEQENGKYQICGPTAFNFYNLDNQIPTVTYAYNNRISGNRTIGSLAFQFIKTADKRLGATNVVRSRDGTGAVYSSRARTLMDAVYDWSRFNSLPRGYDWIRQEVKKDFKLGLELAKAAIRHGNQATIRRIGYLLDTFVQDSRITNQLQRQLNKSKSLIPWIPAKPAKGIINRKWGVIVNE